MIRPIDEFREPDDEARRIADLHDRTPDPALGGLSPLQVYRLIATPWSDPRSPLQISSDLAAEDLRDAMGFHDTCRFLHALRDAGKVKATAAGNLPRSFVEPLVDVMQEAQEYRWVIERRKVINERNLWCLHAARLLCEFATIVGKHKNHFVIRKKRAALMDQARCGELFARLFETQITNIELAFICGPIPVELIQVTLAFILYQLHATGGEWHSIDSISDRVILPTIHGPLVREMTIEGPYPTLASVVESNVLAPLSRWGMIAFEHKRRRLDPRPTYERVRATDLLMKTITFDFDRM